MPPPPPARRRRNRTEVDGADEETEAADGKPTGDPTNWQLRFLTSFNRVYTHGFHRLTIRGPQRIPPRGPAILVCNHISGLDPFLLQGALPRPVVWMMAKEYYDIPGLKWMFEAVGAIPVERKGRDSAATRAALRALAAGRVLGVFPEGKIETTRELLPFQPGVAMLSARAGAPVCPAYLDGSNRGMEMVRAFTTPNEITVRFGEPLTAEPTSTGKPDLDIFGTRILEAVAILRNKKT